LHKVVKRQTNKQQQLHILFDRGKNEKMLIFTWI